MDRRHRPLMPCTGKRARLLLERGRAVVHRQFEKRAMARGGEGARAASPVAEARGIRAGEAR